MKVVPDTNILISGTLWQGPPHKIITLAEDRIIKIYSSSEIIHEVHGVIRRPKFATYLKEAKTTAEEIISRISQLAHFVSPSITLRVVKNDPSDNIFLTCALAANAHFIISGDKHLLDLKSFCKIPILTPSQFLNRIKKGKKK